MNRFVRLLLACACLAAPAIAQTASPQTLDALLAEVRQLRLAIERGNTIVPRVQLLLQRVQMQDAKVSRISRDLQDVRSNIADRATEMPRLRAAQEQLDNRIRQEQNTVERTRLEEDQRNLKAELEQRAAREQQFLAHESELASRLLVEQASLDALQSKLDALEKSLEPAPQQ